jgi:hypothetical protein
VKCYDIDIPQVLHVVATGKIGAISLDLNRKEPAFIRLLLVSALVFSAGFVRILTPATLRCLLLRLP